MTSFLFPKDKALVDLGRLDHPPLEPINALLCMGIGLKNASLSMSIGPKNTSLSISIGPRNALLSMGNALLNVGMGPK
jgi:hypothetical protein